MKPIYSLPLKILRKVYSFFNPEVKAFRNRKMFSNKEYANNLIYEKLMAEEPCMIARIGANELNVLINYIGVKEKKHIKIIEIIL